MSAADRQPATLPAVVAVASVSFIALWSAMIFEFVTKGWWVVAVEPSRRFEDLYERFSDGSVLLHGGNLYALRPQLNNTNPPFVTLAYLPLRALGHSGGAYAMTFISTACIAAVAIIAIRQVTAMDPWPAILLSSFVGVPVALLISYPLQVMYREGQIRALVIVLVVADLLLVPRRFRGLLIGIAAGLTLTPLAFALILWFKDGRSAVVRAIAAMLATMLVGLAAGFGASLHFWFSLLPSGQQVNLVVTNMATVARGTPDFGLRSNASLLAALSRPPMSDVLGLGAAKALSVLLGLVALVLVAFATRALVRRSLPLSAIVLIAVFTLVFSPVSWEHYWIWTLLCPFVAIEVWDQERFRLAASGSLILFAATATDSLGVRYSVVTGHLGSIVLIPVRNLYVSAGLIFMATMLISVAWSPHHAPAGKVPLSTSAR